MKKKSKVTARWVLSSQPPERRIRICDVCGIGVCIGRRKRCSSECVEKRFQMERQAMAVIANPCEFKGINLKCNVRSKGKYGQANKQDQERRNEERKDQSREGYQETSSHGQEAGQEG